MGDPRHETLDALADQQGNRGNGSLALNLEAHAAAWAADRKRLAEMEDSEEMAWIIIANAQDWDVADDGTPCGNKAAIWRRAAEQWRDRRRPDGSPPAPSTI